MSFYLKYLYNFFFNSELVKLLSNVGYVRDGRGMLCIHGEVTVNGCEGDNICFIHANHT